MQIDNPITTPFIHSWQRLTLQFSSSPHNEETSPQKTISHESLSWKMCVWVWVGKVTMGKTQRERENHLSLKFQSMGWSFFSYQRCIIYKISQFYSKISLRIHDIVILWYLPTIIVFMKYESQVWKRKRVKDERERENVVLRNRKRYCKVFYIYK